jgi:hypothetical protein
VREYLKTLNLEKSYATSKCHDERNKDK